MKKFLVLGAGRQGGACAAFLLEQFSDTTVAFVDSNPRRLGATAGLQKDASRVTCHEANVSPVGDDLTRLIGDCDCVISCVPYYYNESLARAAVQAGRPFCDLGGNVGTVEAQLDMAVACREAGVAIVPDCGLAPGVLNVLAEYWAADWEYRSVKLYCGGLPQTPRGTLKYAMTFNICGLLNEYLDDCQVARGGKVEIVEGLGELEALNDLALPGEFEAFATSGGASLGPKIYAPNGVDYIYKTIRYPGHCHVFRAMRDMGFFETQLREFTMEGTRLQVSPRDLSGWVMEENLKSDGKDLVVARADITGVENGRPVHGRIDLIDYAVDRFTAMERTTGFPTAIVAAALVGLYDGHTIEPGAYVPFQVLDPKLTIAELQRAGVQGISVREG